MSGNEAAPDAARLQSCQWRSLAEADQMCSIICIYSKGNRWPFATGQLNLIKHALIIKSARSRSAFKSFDASQHSVIFFWFLWVETSLLAFEKDANISPSWLFAVVHGGGDRLRDRIASESSVTLRP